MLNGIDGIRQDTNLVSLLVVFVLKKITKTRQQNNVFAFTSAQYEFRCLKNKIMAVNDLTYHKNKKLAVIEGN